MNAQRYRQGMGQHFLTNPAWLSQVVAAALSGWQEATAAGQGGGAGGSVLEIGPGRGALTRPLWQAVASHRPELAHFLLVEKDQRLGEGWRVECTLKNLAQAVGGTQYETLVADFLDLKVEQWLLAEPVFVVSNLPYASATAILKQLSMQWGSVSGMVLMFQKEVAERIVAGAGTKSRGVMSLWVQNFWSVEVVLDVPPQAFSPPPQVDSQVVRFLPRVAPRIALAGGSRGAEGQLWQRFLEAAFQAKRKMLRSVFRGPFFAALGGVQLLERSGIEGSLRAEALTWDQWEALFGEVKSAHGTK